MVLLLGLAFFLALCVSEFNVGKLRAIIISLEGMVEIKGKVAEAWGRSLLDSPAGAGLCSEV